MTIQDMVVGLLDLPGSRYSCVAERANGRILIESGAATVDPTVVLRWGMEASTALGMASEGGMEDFILTSSGHYHLVRPMGAARSLLVYLCVDRARANLAVARRELAAARPDERTAAAVVSAPPGRTDARLPAVSRTAAAMPPAASPPARRTAVRRERRAVDVPLPRRTSPASMPAPQPAPPQQRPSRDPVLAQPWADDVATMNRLLTALRALSDHAEST